MLTNVELVILYIFVGLLFTAVPVILNCCNIFGSVGKACLIEIENKESEVERKIRNDLDESYSLIIHC